MNKECRYIGKPFNVVRHLKPAIFNMTPLQIHANRLGFPTFLPIVNSYENGILVCLKQIVIDGSILYKIVHFQKLNDKPRKEIFSAFLQYEDSTHYFINNFTNASEREQFIKELERFASLNDGIIND